jgi:hypothetical protein
MTCGSKRRNWRTCHPSHKPLTWSCGNGDVLFPSTIPITSQFWPITYHMSLCEFTVRNKHDDLTITPQIIACNFSFKNLTSLKFLSGCSTSCQTLDLTDDDIDLLTKAMPGLKSLSIGEQPCSVPSKITFKSLYTISRRCTQLATLQIHFNPNSS